MENRKTPIWVGAIVWKDVSDQGLLVKSFETVLNNVITLEEYGNGIKFIDFIPMAILPTNKIHEEKISYSSRYKVLNIHLKLDYNQVVAAGVDGFLPLVGQLLLEGIDQAPKKRIKQFDWVRFKKDIANLLAENGWLLPAERV